MLSRRRLIPWLVAVSAILPPFCGHVFGATPAGIVVGLVGQCYVQRGGNPTPVKLGDAVSVSDIFSVPADGKLKLRMEDGSVISLASGTRVTITAYQATPAGRRENAVLSLGEGLLRAIVTTVDQPATFEVKTAVGTAAVRSTDWFVEANAGSARVGVLTGAVVLTSAATGAAVTIPSGFGARLEAGRNPGTARVWASEEFQAVIARTNLP